MRALNSIDTSDWVNGLAKELDDLAESIAGVRYRMPTLSNSQYRALAHEALRDTNAHMLFEEYLPKLGSDPTATTEILKEHPILRREVVVSGDEAAIMVLSPPGSARRVELDRLALYLAKTSVQKGGNYAAEILDKYLKLGDLKDLPGQEITIFRGLIVDQRFELAPGAFIAPYGEVVEEGLLRERKYYPEEEPIDYRQMHAAVVVRDLRWGPSVKPPMTINTPPKEMSTGLSFAFLDGIDGLSVLFDFLSIVTRCHLDALSVQYRVGDFMEEIHPQFKVGSTTAYLEHRLLSPFWQTSESLEPEHVATLREVLSEWESSHGFPRHALSRLAASVARTGRLRREDSILDLSIALEIMYSIDLELKYKLGTRLGYFLGSEATDRTRLFSRVGRLYDVRSAIVHGRQTNRQELDEAYSEGFNLARETLFKLVRTRIDGDPNSFWNNLVMSGGLMSQPSGTGKG